MGIHADAHVSECRGTKPAAAARATTDFQTAPPCAEQVAAAIEKTTSHGLVEAAISAKRTRAMGALSWASDTTVASTGHKSTESAQSTCTKGNAVGGERSHDPHAARSPTWRPLTTGECHNGFAPASQPLHSPYISNQPAPTATPRRHLVPSIEYFLFCSFNNFADVPSC